MIQRFKENFNTEAGARTKDMFVRSLAVIGFFAILFVGLWGTVQVVKVAPQAFSTLAAVTTSLTQTFFSADTEEGQEGNAEEASSSNQTEESTTPNENVSGNEENTQGTAQALTPGERVDNVFPINDSRAPSNPNGEPDLVARILSVGEINSAGVFVPKDSITVGNKGAVMFEVQNNGTKTSDTWVFNAVLPTFPMHIFHSQTQQALNPGEKIQYTLGFDQIDYNKKEGVVTINVDPAGSMKESNENNNIAQRVLKIISN